MKRLLIILLTSFVANSAFSQLTNLQNIANGAPMTATYPGISGNPYFTDFVSGEVLLANGSVFAGLIRYNGHLNEVEYKEDFEVYSLRERQVQSFKINDAGVIKSFEKGLYTPGGTTLFYQKIAENSGLTLIKVYTSSIGQDSNASSYGSVMGKAFVKNMTNFLCSEEGCFELKNTKATLELLPETLHEQANDIVKTNKLNLKREEDTVKFINELK